MTPQELLQLRSTLATAIKIIDAELSVDESDECLHMERIEMTVMGTKEKSFLCDSCGARWTEQHNEEDIRGFRGLGGI